MPIRVCAFLLFLFPSLHAYAQQQLVEGELVYSVSIRKSGENEQFVKAGTYSIFLKGSTIRKDIKLHNGYSNTIIINNNEGSVYSLKQSAANKFAIQLSLQELQARERQYQGFTLTGEGEQATIAGYKAQRGKVKYKDGSESPIQYTQDFSIAQPYVFNHLPGISVVPLFFEIANDDGTIMRFEAQKVVAKPVESSLFKIPSDYKIISNEEYRQISR